MYSEYRDQTADSRCSRSVENEDPEKVPEVRGHVGEDVDDMAKDGLACPVFAMREHATELGPGIPLTHIEAAVDAGGSQLHQGTGCRRAVTDQGDGDCVSGIGNELSKSQEAFAGDQGRGEQDQTR